jgi:hypothetical protein
MRAVKNSVQRIKAGDSIKLINGKNIPIPCGESYDWENSEIVERIDGKVILFKGLSSCDWYTLDMPWEITKSKKKG